MSSVCSGTSVYGHLTSRYYGHPDISFLSSEEYELVRVIRLPVLKLLLSSPAGDLNP